MHAEHSLLFDDRIGNLDRDLVNSLIALDSAENRADEPHQSSRSILLTAATWFIGGMCLWVAAALYL